MQHCTEVMQNLKDAVKAACPTLVLASQSPNRRQMLLDCGVNVIAKPQDIWEICGETEPARVVTELSRQKMDSYLNSAEFDPRLPAVGVDTLVSLDGELLGKPKDDVDAIRMLHRLSGVWHEVFSGMSVYNPATGKLVVFSDVTRVLFRRLSDEDISWYVSTGDPIGAAGAYKIQRYGYRLIDGIEGSFSNIIGIPLEKLVEALG